VAGTNLADTLLVELVELLSKSNWFHWEVVFIDLLYKFVIQSKWKNIIFI